MNKIDNLIKSQIKRNFYTFFVLVIVALLASVIQIIASALLKKDINKNLLIGILAIITLTNIIMLLTSLSYMPIFKERKNLNHNKLLKTVFGLVIALIAFILIFFLLIFLINGTHQAIINAYLQKNLHSKEKNINLFMNLKIIKLIFDSLLILNIITILGINITIKKRGGILNEIR
ncbi:hypothetical protein ACT1UH_00505 [Mycoplasma sp. 332]|uniref:hypothetical protein n=1 Tax=unclassified Asterococcus (in: mycoplasmas, genus) TaxID=3407551 RepID=UPI003F659F12